MTNISQHRPITKEQDMFALVEHSQMTLETTLTQLGRIYSRSKGEKCISYFRRSSRISTSFNILSLVDVLKLLLSSSFVSINLWKVKQDKVILSQEKFKQNILLSSKFSVLCFQKHFVAG